MDVAFRDPGILRDDELRLELAECYAGDPALGYVPSYKFEMRLDGKRAAIGNLSLRLGDGEFLVMYAGQVAYAVDERHRGHRYAARAVRLILPLAHAHGMNPLWITCNPGNAASRRTCELAGGVLVGIVDLPPDCDMARRGERQKCRYRFDLTD